jgi:dTDP-glucose 4,6-dehydratase
MKKILVTGAAGFIGSNFVHLLLADSTNDWYVVGYDALTYAGNISSLTDCLSNKRFEFIKGDICDTFAVDENMRDIDVVVNFAAESHVDRSIMNTTDFIHTNVEGTRVLSDAAIKHKVKLFIQVSTDEVYGSLGETGLFTENTSLRPNSPYSASKAAADLLVMAYHHTFGFPVIVTRCSNNYGPYQFPEKLIPLFVTNLLEGKKLPVYGDGMQIRDWLHVDDHCGALLAVIQRGKVGQIYNIGGDNQQCNIGITKIILKHLGKDESYIEYVTDRPGHDRRYAIDATKIKQQLGWKTQVPFEDGLRNTINWYIENKSWWSAIKTGEYMTYYEKQYGSRKSLARTLCP